MNKLLIVTDGALNPPHFYPHEEIDAALVAVGRPARPRVQPPVDQPPVSSEQTVTTPQLGEAVMGNLSIPIDATGKPYIFHQ